jgi:hypothetical protein
MRNKKKITAFVVAAAALLLVGAGCASQSSAPTPATNDSGAQAPMAPSAPGVSGTGDVNAQAGTAATDPAAATNAPASGAHQWGQGAGGTAGAHNGGFVGGTITAIAGSTITLQARDGSSKTIDVSGTTTVQISSQGSAQPQAGSISDLKVGDHIAVTGTPNADGSVNAQSIRSGNFGHRGSGGTGGSATAGGTAPGSAAQ